MKACFKCGEVKPLTEYYKHPAMGDGHLGKCKTCTKADTAARVALKQSDPYWVVAEAKRHREKQAAARASGKAAPQTANQRKAILEKHAAKYPEKNAARIALGNAVRDGKITKAPCEICGSLDSEGHHDDYSKPLDVKWLCPKHHAERHVQLRDEQRRQRALARAPVLSNFGA